MAASQPDEVVVLVSDDDEACAQTPPTKRKRRNAATNKSSEVTHETGDKAKTKKRQLKPASGRLSGLQRRGLGELCKDQGLCAPRALDLYSTLDKDAGLVDEDIDELQTFDDFVEMGKVGKANAQGTGRFKVTPGRRTLKILRLAHFVKNKSHLAAMDRMCTQVAQIFGAYFLGASIAHARPLPLVASKDDISIIDEERGLAFPLETVALDSGKRAVDVFSIMNVIEEYLTRSTFAIIVLTDLCIADPELPDAEILGRATGDRVAVVHCCERAMPNVNARRQKPPSMLSTALVAATAVHEAMHTLGLDHCVSWRCVMNAYMEAGEEDENGEADADAGKAGGKSTKKGHGDGGGPALVGTKSLGPNLLPLCPLDLAKMRLALGFDLAARFTALGSICRVLASSASDSKTFWARHASWFESRGALLQATAAASSSSSSSSSTS